MKRTKIFISYDYDNDWHYQKLPSAWDANGCFDFSFSNQSTDVRISSTDATTVKRAISAKINNSAYFLCSIDEKTRKSDWEGWDIDKVVKLERKMVAEKIGAGKTPPDNILGLRASSAKQFTGEAILNTLR